VPVEDTSSKQAVSVTQGIFALPGLLARYFRSFRALRAGALALMLALASVAFAADQKSNPNPCKLSDAEAAGLNRDLSTDIHATGDYGSVIARFLKQEKFEQLDCLADQVRSGKERFSGGTWKIHILYEGLERPVEPPMHATSEDWNMLGQRLQRWQLARPKSITARVALAWVDINYAWEARGDGFAKTVSENGWKTFGERITEAKRILDDASTLPTKCPEWYTAMQDVARDEGWSMDKARDLYDEAVKFEPDYYYFARNMAYYLLPKWHGEQGDTEKFMQETADRLGGDKGDILYFQVATFVICGCEEDPHLSSERIEKGFEASERQYGVSMLNLNLIASLESKYRESDAVLVEKVLARIGGQWDEDTWGTKKDFDAAKEWATLWAPRVAKERAMVAAAQANMKTPEGVRYRVVFEKAYRDMLQQCVRTDGSTVQQWQGQFETIISVGANGRFEDGMIGSMGPVVMCMYRKMRISLNEKSQLFPPAPQDPFWIRLDLDWADFAPVAAK
jgi:hypothetical protein